jgi:hypothetical protein
MIDCEPPSDELSSSSSNQLKRRLAMRRVYEVGRVLARGRKVFVGIDVHRQSFPVPARKLSRLA